MSSRPLLVGATLCFLLGIAGLVAGGLLLWRPPVAEARLAVTVAADPTPETFASVVEASTRIVTTLAELSSFDTFQEEVARSGFDITRRLLSGSPEDRRRVWDRHLAVERVDDTLVLRVRARGRTAKESRALAGAVVHALALHAPAVVGNHIVHTNVERVPVVKTVPGGGALGGALLGAGIAGIIVGLGGWLVGHVSRPAPARERKRRPVRERGIQPLPLEGSPPPVAPVHPPEVPRLPRLSSEEARFWLQKFLEEHQNVPRKSDRDIQTWEDFPEAELGTDWLRAPDALREEP